MTAYDYNGVEDTCEQLLDASPGSFKKREVDAGSTNDLNGPVLKPQNDQDIWLPYWKHQRRMYIYNIVFYAFMTSVTEQWLYAWNMALVNNLSTVCHLSDGLGLSLLATCHPVGLDLWGLRSPECSHKGISTRTLRHSDEQGNLSRHCGELRSTVKTSLGEESNQTDEEGQSYPIKNRIK